MALAVRQVSSISVASRLATRNGSFLRSPSVYQPTPADWSSLRRYECALDRDQNSCSSPKSHVFQNSLISLYPSRASECHTRIERVPSKRDCVFWRPARLRDTLYHKTRGPTHSLGAATTLSDRPKSASPEVFRVDTIDFPNSTFTSITGISPEGDLVGFSLGQAGDQHGFVFNDSKSSRWTSQLRVPVSATSMESTQKVM